MPELTEFDKEMARVGLGIIEQRVVEFFAEAEKRYAPNGTPALSARTAVAVLRKAPVKRGRPRRDPQETLPTLPTLPVEIVEPADVVSTAEEAPIKERRVTSPAVRKRMKLAMKKRWADARAAGKTNLNRS